MVVYTYYHFFMLDISRISEILGDEAESLLNFSTPKIPKTRLHLPSKHFFYHTFSLSDRSHKVIDNLVRLRKNGRLKKTGYLSILPVDQGIEHTAGARFASNPRYFDPEHILKLAIEGGCNGVASSYGTLAILSRKYASKIPFIVKLNHNDLFRFPNDYDQTMFTTVKKAYEMGARGVGATIYFGSPESKRQITEVSEAFAAAHEKGMFTVLWCYVRNTEFTVGKVDYSASADLTGQANYLGATIGADIVKQKLPTLNGGYLALNKGKSTFGKYDERMYTELSTEHPIDLCRYQVLHGYAGRIGLISSGGESNGESDLQDAVRSAVINKRAGGMGLILGRKAFEKPLKEGIEILNAVQDVYLCKEVTVA
jgi:class I fructose-bisphosphate aldolase